MSWRPLLGAFLRRDWAIDSSYRLTFVLGLATALITLTLFYYLGEIVDEDALIAEGVDGGYFGFVALGIGIFTILQGSLISFSRKLREEQTTGTFEALMTTPADPGAIILASAAYDLLRATVNGLILIVGAIVIFSLQFDPSPSGFSVAFVALLAALTLFASLGVVVAALTVLFKRTTVLVALATSMIALLSGVYFPIDVLPEPLESIAAVIPFTWCLDLVRASLLGGDVDSAQLIGLIASAAVSLPLSLVAFRAAVARSRSTGTLAHY